MMISFFAGVKDGGVLKGYYLKQRDKLSKRVGSEIANFEVNV